MKKSSRKVHYFLPFIGRIYEREDRLKARVGSLRQRIKANNSTAASKLKELKAAAAEELKAEKAAGAEKLKAVKAASSAKLKSVEAASSAKLQAVEAASSAKLKVVEAAAAAKLKAERAADGAKLEAVKAENMELQERLLSLTRRSYASFRAAGDPNLQRPFLEFLHHLAPRRVVGLAKVRAGRMADGGYVMLDDFAGIQTAISGGIGDDVSWDLDMGERGIDVIQVDYSVEGPPMQHPRFDFRKLQLVGSCEQPNDVTLSSLIESCPGDGPSILCKLDIEGSEWDVFAQPVSGLRRCRQIVVEFHKLAQFGSSQWRSRAMRCLEQITAEHQCIHLHGNNAVSPPFVVFGGIPFPSVFEATFVLRDRYVFEEEADSFPTSIDAPNLANRADIFLGRLARLANGAS